MENLHGILKNIEDTIICEVKDQIKVNFVAIQKKRQQQAIKASRGINHSAALNANQLSALKKKRDLANSLLTAFKSKKASKLTRKKPRNV